MIIIVEQFAAGVKIRRFAREMACSIINPAIFGCDIYGAKDKVLDIL